MIVALILLIALVMWFGAMCLLGYTGYNMYRDHKTDKKYRSYGKDV